MATVLPAFTVTAGAIGLIEAGLSVADIAALGLSASDIAAGGTASFFGGDGNSGFTTLGSYQNAITNGASANTSPSGTQFGNQQVYNETYQSAINGGSTPQQAAQYAQLSSGGYTPGAAGGASGAAPANLGTQVAGETTSGAGGITQMAPVVVNGGGSSALGSLGTGAGTLSGMGSSPGLNPSQYSTTDQAILNSGGPSSSLSPLSSVSAGGTGATDVEGAGAGSNTLGTAIRTTAPLATALTAGGSILGGLTGAGSSGPLSTQAPNPATVAGGILQDEINFAPSILATTQQNAPAYNTLQNQDLNANATNLASQYAGTAASLQGTQSAVNAQQAAAQQQLLSQYGGSTVSAYQAANPQLQALQGQYTALAQSQPTPVGQISGAGAWAAPFSSQVQSTIAQNQVTPTTTAPTEAVTQGSNQTLAQLNQTAQQQLALGTSVSPQEQATVANQVLSNYNQMGRANDPTAIAGLATGLDTYGQQLLTQRETNAATAANATTSQNALGVSAGQANLAASQQSALANQQTNLTASQANQNAAIAGLGLTGSALSSGGAQSLSAAQSNQSAQLANANYDQSLLQGASALAQSTAAVPLSQLYTQSQGLTNAQNVGTQAGQGTSAANSLSGLYNPFDSSAYTSAYNANANANQTNATTNAGLVGGGLSLLGSLANSYLSSPSG